MGLSEKDIKEGRGVREENIMVIKTRIIMADYIEISSTSNRSTTIMQTPLPANTVTEGDFVLPSRRVTNASSLAKP
jgi:hypothetical protein